MPFLRCELGQDLSRWQALIRAAHPRPSPARPMLRGVNSDLEAMFSTLRQNHPESQEQEVIDTWETLFAGATASGTLKAWMQARDGRLIDTFQFDRRDGEVWAPGARTLDSSSRAGAMSMNGSEREYAGMRVLAATDTAIAAANDWHICLYTDAS